MQTENFVQSVKAAVFGVLFSIVFALALALIVRLSPMGASAQKIIAQSLKAVSLTIGCLSCVKSEGGWKKGLFAGALFTMLTYLSFSTIAGDFGWSWKLLFDLLLGLGVGGMSGVAAVNLKKA